MRRAFGYIIAILIIAVTMTACGNGDEEANSIAGQEQYEWVALEQLLLPTPLPEKGKYAILAGQFADPEAADQLRNRVRSFGLRSSMIPVVDNEERHWFCVSAGTFDSLDDARVQRWPISLHLGFSEPLPLILLPT